HLDGSLQVQDVGISLARSDDGGESWRRVGTVAAPSPATVTDTLPNHPICGAATCSGRWAYETSWLVEDAEDVAARRYKLYAHQYFLYPPAGEGKRTVYVLGAIVTWSAATADGLVSASPAVALRWNLTPPELPAGGVNVNGLSGDLAGCLAVAEGGASVRPGAMDLVAACTYAKAGVSPLPQKVVLLRSVDHGQSFRYVSTLLDAADAAPLGASYFTAPSLLPEGDAAPVLFATPAFSGIYGGCVAIPFSDLEHGVLARAGGGPAVILRIPSPPVRSAAPARWTEGSQEASFEIRWPRLRAGRRRSKSSGRVEACEAHGLLTAHPALARSAPNSPKRRSRKHPGRGCTRWGVTRAAWSCRSQVDSPSCSSSIGARSLAQEWLPPLPCVPHHSSQRSPSRPLPLPRRSSRSPATTARRWSPRRSRRWAASARS
ncbi:MAG TPA: hypothetical protein VK454_01495, partial [Myxococcaceae bacterium]|nr:hypothetical protein [Myxococcaceae bacterium]